MSENTQQSQNYILQLEGVCKTYPGTDFFLDHISLALPCGAIMGLVGENGAGKTTAIGCLLGCLRPDSGRVRLLGREPGGDEAALREAVGVVFDGDNFPGWLTARQLSSILAGSYRQWDAALYEQYLAAFRLPPRQKLKTYSRGMSMKLALAAALSHHPRLLILDEATAGLDPIVRDEMLDIFLDFVGQEDRAILLSSHITADLEKAADYIVFIHQGRVLLSAAKDDLLYNYAILRCGEKQFQQIDKGDLLAFRRRDYQTDALVCNGEAARRKYPDILADRAGIDEIMLIMTKGERV